MKKMQTVLYRYRLITNILALVLLLGALAVTPASADDEFVIEEGGGVYCENGCTAWTQQGGCLKCQRCCASSSSGQWGCWSVDASLCP